MLKDVALWRTPLMFDPRAKILLSLKQTQAPATENYRPDVAHLGSLEESWLKWSNLTRSFRKHVVPEVSPTRSGLSESLYRELHNHRKRWGEGTLSLVNLRFIGQGKESWWISQSSGTAASNIGKKQPHQALHRTSSELSMEGNPFMKCLSQEHQYQYLGQWI